jgi:hypothetical protein
VSDSPAIHSRWLLLLKIEISSNGQNFTHRNKTTLFGETRGSQEPVIAHLVFNLTSKVNRKWGWYPLNQIKPNLAGMVPGWVPFKFVSDSPALHSRWLLLLKIKIWAHFDIY